MGLTSTALTRLDLMVLAVYFIAIICSGVLFKDRFRNVRDYFAAGGNMVWWIAGFSAITSELSVFAFTASAGKYAQHGVTLLYANLLSMATLPLLYWLGPRFRRLQVSTGLEAVRLRFGPMTERLYSFLLIPLGIWGGAMGIHITATFLSAACGLDIDTVVFVVGGFTVVMSALGGIWAVATSDLFQGGLSLFMMVILLGYAACSPGVQEAGGLLNSVPGRLLDVFQSSGPTSLIIWTFAMTSVTVLSRFSMLHDGVKFLVARSEQDCRRMVTVIIVISFCLAPLVALPAMISSNIIGAEASTATMSSPEGVISLVAKQVLPAGMFGLLLAGIIAAAMNSMDNALNRNAGFFVTSIYQQYIRKQASAREAIVASRIATLVSGGGGVLVALLLNHHREIGLFDFVLLSNSLLAIPLMIPLALGILFPNAPGWAGWGGLLLCAVVSWCSNLLLDAASVLHGLGVMAPSPQDIQDTKVGIQIIGTCLVGVIFFGFASIVEKLNFEKINDLPSVALPGLPLEIPENLIRKTSKSEFWVRWNTPVQEAPSEGVGFQYRNTGLVLLTFGLGLACLAPLFAFPEEFVLVVGIAVSFALPGLWLWRSGRKNSPSHGR